MKKGCLVLFVLFLLAAGSLAVGAFILGPPLMNQTLHEETVIFTVESGESLHQVSRRLREEGVIRSALWFRRQAQEAGIDRQIKPGPVEIQPEDSIHEIFEKMMVDRERRAHQTITFPEGYSLYQMATRLEEQEITTGDAFLEAVDRYYRKGSYEFDDEPLYFPLEGYLFPDTYYIELDATPDDIVALMAEQMNKVLTEEVRQKAEEQGMTLHQLLTKASLIEKEAFGDHERATIAGVIQNRLEKGMLLQFCSSVLYGLDDGKELANRLLYADLEVPHPFNTYKYPGLPPGPIANPGKASIEAALHPESHEYLYFVVGDGGHNFSREYRDHLQNVEAYRNQRSE